MGNTGEPIDVEVGDNVRVTYKSKRSGTEQVVEAVVKDITSVNMVMMESEDRKGTLKYKRKPGGGLISDTYKRRERIAWSDDVEIEVV